MCNEEKITFGELQLLAEDLEVNGIEMELFSINKLIDITQISNEFDVYRRTKNEILTPIEYIHKFYSGAIKFIVKTKTKDDCVDNHYNINEDTFYIRKANSHVAVHALSIIYHLSLQ
ncbi:hypothetical protein [Vagococcus carniphilus]|uniref:Uncharacterized protein n=1 Tax=Vagococcus carniphilus TaxID=218144 RepID=A0A430ARX6_9ENTE|nr:hypothetical protein [Vagococcus carniphilus]MDT2813291.1 hypothetical protein [Vagococcus carniphilus]QNN73262.1 hypothetical protein H9L18_01295 [Vagococcus carniphilus]RSU10800.1 hypothetical protein CBF28_12940 [Vagococcus carniphilus]